MHPNFVVYNPKTLMKLRDAVGEEIGANCDLSHLFWQGCDPVEVIHYLGKQGAIYHAHMEDTVIVKDVAARFGVLNFPEDPAKAAEGSLFFRAVGYGHGAQLWLSHWRVVCTWQAWSDRSVARWPFWALGPWG